MPSITSYTPYETLAFFQSIAERGADASAFQDISTALTQNEYIRQSKSYNGDRLSAEALRSLYGQLIDDQKASGSVKINGDSETGERSPKRRKLSETPQPDREYTHGEHQLVQALVDRLYTQYKAEVVQMIREDEETYVRLQSEITLLESKASKVEAEHESKQDGQSATPAPSDQAQQLARPDQEKAAPRNVQTLQQASSTAQQPIAPGLGSQDNGTSRAPSQTSPDDGSAATPSAQGRPTHPSPIALGPEPATPRPQSDNQVARGSHFPSTQAQHGLISQSRPLQPPASQRSSHGQIQGQSGFSPGPQPPAGHVMSPVPQPPPPRPLPARHGSSQGHVSPVPHQPQPPYPPYPQYPPQWHPHMHPQYQQHPGYPPPHFYPQPVPGRHPQTPQQIPYQPYPHTAPVHYPPPNWRGQHYSQYPASTATTPISRPDSRLSVTKSASSTPWKRRRDAVILRATSPARPERDVSPLTDGESSPKRSAHKTDDHHPRASKNAEATPMLQPRTGRRGRPPSKTPSAIGPSRSQSIASQASETGNERAGTSRRSQKIKAEPPSTPLPPTSDSEQPQRSSGRRGRPRTNTVNSEAPRANAKRKRDSPSPSPTLRSPTGNNVHTRDDQAQPLAHDPSLIIVSKNFSRTSQLLLNEITSHKLASIFAKPLSERDAPGYRDLIFRPQDLKSIKAAISKGTRAALGAIEALDNETEGTTPINTTAESPFSGTAPGPLGNGFYLVTKSIDLIPPKGIVNSAQLEMELMRMFANAIMFNPLPSSERGFGKALRLRKNGGDALTRHRQRGKNPEDGSDDDSDDGGTAEDADAISLSSSSLSGTDDGPAVGRIGWDEGGIIADTREMFEDVVETVVKWRNLEGERMGTAITASNNHPLVDSSRTGSFATPSISGDKHGHLLQLDGVSARQTSVPASVNSNIGDDDGGTTAGDGESTPVPGSTLTSTARKRRRVGEH